MAYATTRDHLLDELDRIETLLSGVSALVDSAEPTTGTAPPDSDVEPDPRDLGLAIPEPYHERVSDHTAEIRRRRAETPDETTLRLGILADRFDLSRRHLDVLVLALAPDIDPDFERTYRMLHDTSDVVRPTVNLLADCFATTEAQRFVATELVGTASPLREHGLITIEMPDRPGATILDHEIVVTDHIRSYLQDHDGLDPALNGVASLLTVTTGLDDLTVDDGVRERVTNCTGSTDSASRYYFFGPDGAQKRRGVEAVADDAVIRASLPRVLESGALERLRREASLQDCPLHLTDATDVVTSDSDVTLEAIFEELGDLQTDVFVTGTEEWTPTETLETELNTIVEFPYPSIDLRQSFWERHADDLPDGVDPAVLAGTFRLTQGELDAALSTAHSLTDDEELTPEDIYEGCSSQSAAGLSDLAQHIEPSSDWDDIQLPDGTMRKLRIVRNHVKHKARIYGQWGYEEQFSRGTGVIALFSGPSGTGKTMAAEILAGDVGMDLYKIDLSSVVSKYIGETEENLEEIFEAAENSNAILLFDEADAVFGERSEVSDSTDRYANVEVNYLLQRIESFDGVVLLTTNYESNIDTAFTRRIDHTVAFSRPKQATRNAIWQGIFPEAAPLGDIDYDFLADFDFTGGQIQTIGQTAAILAADDSDTIEMEHVVQAMQLTSEKEGKLLDSGDYGQYQHHLYTADNTADSGDETADTHDESETTEPRESPESVVRTFFDHLAAGDGEAAHSRYHSSAIADRFSYQQLAKLQQGTLEIVSEFERIRDGSETVVLRFTQNLNGNREQLEYELRLDGDEWRIFNFGRARSDDHVVEP